MTSVQMTFSRLSARFAAVPFSPFRGSGQGVRQPFGETFESVRFSSEDGTPLAGRLAIHRDGKPHPSIVTSHGIWMMKEIDALVDMAEFYHGNGWNVLVFDFRGHGESAKLSDAPYTMGWKEADDMLGAARYLRSLGDSVGSIALVGYSLAGAATLLAAERAVGLADCLIVGSAPARQEPHFIMSHIDKWLRIAKTDPISYFEQAGAYYGKSGEEVRTLDETVDALERLTIPTLFIQTAEDDFIPPPDAAQLERAARSNPNVLVLTQARGGHGVEMYLNDRYWLKAVTSAFLKAIQAPDSTFVSDEPAPPLDLQLTLAPGWENLLIATVWLRNSASEPLRDITVRLPLLDTPGPSFVAAPPQFGPVIRSGAELSWHAASIPGNGELVGPFTIALPQADIVAGTRLRTRAVATWNGPDSPARSNEGAFSQR